MTEVKRFLPWLSCPSCWTRWLGWRCWERISRTTPSHCDLPPVTYSNITINNSPLLTLILTITINRLIYYSLVHNRMSCNSYEWTWKFYKTICRLQATFKYWLSRQINSLLFHQIRTKVIIPCSTFLAETKGWKEHFTLNACKLSVLG